MDLERYFEFMPQDKKEKIHEDVYQMQNIQRLFKNKDPKLYQIGNLWYHVLEKRLMQKRYQCLSNNPTFDINRHYQKMVKNFVDGDPGLLVFADYIRPIKRV